MAQQRTFVFIGEEEQVTDVVSQVMSHHTVNADVMSHHTVNADASTWTLTHESDTATINYVNLDNTRWNSPKPFDNVTAVFFILKAPEKFSGGGGLTPKNRFESYLKDAKSKEMPSGMPIFVVLTGTGTLEAASNWKKSLFQNETGALQEKNISLVSFKDSDQLFRNVYFLPDGEDSFIGLLFTHEPEKKFKIFACEVSTPKTEPLKSSNLKAEKAKSSNSSTDTKTTNSSTATQTSTLNRGGVARKPDEKTVVCTVTRVSQQERLKIEGEKKLKGKPSKEKQPAKTAVTRFFSQAKGGDEKVIQKKSIKGKDSRSFDLGGGDPPSQKPLQTNVTVRHKAKFAALKKGAAAGLITALVIALLAVIFDVASRGLFLLAAPGGMLFDFIGGTFLTALTPLGFFTLLAGLAVVAVVASVAFYRYYQSNQSPHVDLAIKIAIATWTLAAVAVVIADLYLKGALFEISSGPLYQLIAGSFLASAPPAWFLVVLVVLTVFVVGLAVGAAAGGVSKSASIQKAPSKQEDLGKTLDLNTFLLNSQEQFPGQGKTVSVAVTPEASNSSTPEASNSSDEDEKKSTPPPSPTLTSLKTG
jgi:hypothetical protein